MCEAMLNHNYSPDSVYDPTKLALPSVLRPRADFESKSGHDFGNTIFIDYKVHLIDEEKIVTCVQYVSGANFDREKIN